MFKLTMPLISYFDNDSLVCCIDDFFGCCQVRLQIGNSLAGFVELLIGPKLHLLELVELETVGGV